MLAAGQKRPHPDNEQSWSIEWKPAGATIETHRKCVLALEGRGKMRSLSPQHIIIVANGYSLPSSEKSDDECRRSPPFIEFDSPNWGSVITLEMPEGAILEISCLPNRVRVLSAHDPEARPTVFPSSWQNAVQEVEIDWQNFLQRRTRESSLMFESNLLGDSTGSEISPEQTFKVAFIGSKGVGKSTCLRYCLNRLLSNPDLTPAVAVLDADVGQPELGPPGMLTLSMRTEPLLKHPYAHFLSKQRQVYVDACFYGSTSSQINPDRYIQCVRHLLNAYNSRLGGQIPLLINMDGWVQGLGLEILQSLIQDILHPTHVIQIQGDTKSRAFELNVGQGQLTLHSCRAFNSTCEKSVDYQQKWDDNQDEITKRDSSAEPVPSDSPKQLSDLVSAPTMSLPPSSLRNLRLLAYFLDTAESEDLGDVWDSTGVGQNKQEGFLQDINCELAKRLASSSPYIVPFETMECTFASLEQQTDFERRSNVTQETKMEYLMKLFNGSIVGLCSNVSAANSRGSDVIATCIGLGIVRSVDVCKGLFYILTPLQSHKLHAVNVLCLASNTIGLSMEAIFRGVMSESFPRISFEIGASKLRILGADPMKSRNSIGRKSLQNSASTLS